jgi:TRAP-type C4-dicarboxylate transport system substrate-binding protein
MPFPEVFTALQQGAVDAQENPLSLIISSRFFEAQEHLSLTGHVYSPGLILASPILWDRLSEEEQGWVTEAAQAGAAASREHIQRLKREGVERLRGKGMTVITDVDIGPFQEQMQPVYESFREQYGDEMLDRILAFEY